MDDKAEKTSQEKKRNGTWKRTLFLLLGTVMIFAGVIFFYKGCQVTGTETRSYHKVYKDKRTGTWEGRDVSYEADAMDNIDFLLIGIPLLLGGGVLTMVGMSIKKPEEDAA